MNSDIASVFKTPQVWNQRKRAERKVAFAKERSSLKQST